MNILAAVSLVAILVFIHEFGHYVVAKMCGVHVKIFSLGYGRRVAGFMHNGTDYRLSLLPFGGYVMMAGADPFGYGDEDDEELEDLSQSFMRRPVWQRLLIIAAGPAVNLVFPVIVFTMLFMAGEPQPASAVGEVKRGSLADEAGIIAGDRLIAIDGESFGTWSGMAAIIATLEHGEHEVIVERAGAPLSLLLTMDENDSRTLGVGFIRPDSAVGVDDPVSPAGVAGIETSDRIIAVGGDVVVDWIDLNQKIAAFDGDVLPLTVEALDGETRDVVLSRDSWAPLDNGLPLLPAQHWGMFSATLFVSNVSETVEDDGIEVLSGCRPGPAPPPSPAMLQGIAPGDRFFRINDQPIASWSEVLETVAGSMVGTGETATANPVKLELVREGELQIIEVTPRVITALDDVGVYHARPILGTARGGDYMQGPMTRQYYPFSTAFRRSSEETVLISKLIVERLGMVVTGEAAVDKSLGGPLEIVRQASAAAQQGLFTWVRLMAMLSISLGIVNLVPVPVLDGGQILFYLLEAIRGRPVSHQFRERAQQIGVLFLVALMLAILVFDIHRLFEG